MLWWPIWVSNSAEAKSQGSWPWVGSSPVLLGYSYIGSLLELHTSPAQSQGTSGVFIPTFEPFDVRLLPMIGLWLYARTNFIENNYRTQQSLSFFLSIWAVSLDRTSGNIRLVFIDANYYEIAKKKKTIFVILYLSIYLSVLTITTAIINVFNCNYINLYLKLKCQVH